MRVRREVVAALGQTSQAAARPILMDLADGAEPPLFVAIVRQLTLDDHASIQDWLLSLLRSDAFPRRSEDERRAVFQALATRGDAALTDLETELNRGGLLSRRPEPDRTAIALCLARIGTPAARAILELGTRSRNAAVRKACSIAAASRGGGDE
jgi:HEAT repeat protein